MNGSVVNNLIFGGVLIALITVGILRSAYAGQGQPRPGWTRWFDGGIAILVIVYLFFLTRYALTVQ